MRRESQPAPRPGVPRRLAAAWAVVIVLSAAGPSAAQQRAVSAGPPGRPAAAAPDAASANAGASIPAAVVAPAASAAPVTTVGGGTPSAPSSPSAAGGASAPAAALSAAVAAPAPPAAGDATLPASPSGLSPAAPAAPSFPGFGQVPDLSKRENVSAAMQLIVLLTVLSLAPAILLMMTCFTRIVIVLSLLRQALGTQSLPPNQVMIGLSMFMTFLVMGPTMSEVNDKALKPYMEGRVVDGRLFDQQRALDEAERPIRAFMIRQIERSGNEEDVDLFAGQAGQPRARSWGDVKTSTLVPAFMLSELKTAFTMGFKIYLPFLVIDMVISTVLISMGMMMLPPAMISLPFKLLLFVLVDGWHLIVGNLMGSFA